MMNPDLESGFFLPALRKLPHKINLKTHPTRLIQTQD